MGRIGRSSKPTSRPVSHEVVAVVLIAIAALLLLSLATYNPKDLSWNSTGPAHAPSNLIGRFGAYVGDFFIQLFGLASFSIPILMTAIALRTLLGGDPVLPARKVAGSILLLVALSGFLALFPDMGISFLRNSHNGGVVGYLVEGGLAHVMNTAGAAIVLSATTLLTLMLAMEISLHRLGAVLALLGTHLPRISKEKPMQAQPPEERETWLTRWRRSLEARAEAKRARALAKLRMKREARAASPDASMSVSRKSSGL